MTETRPSGGYGPINGRIWPMRSASIHRGVWHYTDAWALTSIVQNDELWASAATMMNDPSEQLYGAKRIKGWYDEHGASFGLSPQVHMILTAYFRDFTQSLRENPAYVVSASTRPDLLGQWRSYAATGGYAVRLDTSPQMGVVVPESFDPTDKLALIPDWIDVAYRVDEQNARIEHEFREFADATSIFGRMLKAGDAANVKTLIEARLAALAASMKDDAFEDEREVRLIAFPPPTVQPEHRASVRGVVPYLRLHCVADADIEVVPPKRPLPIGEVRVGPPQGESENQRRAGVQSLLRAHGRGDLAVNGSGIPYLP